MLPFMGSLNPIRVAFMTVIVIPNFHLYVPANLLAESVTMAMEDALRDDAQLGRLNNYLPNTYVKVLCRHCYLY